MLEISPKHLRVSRGRGTPKGVLGLFIEFLLSVKHHKYIHSPLPPLNCCSIPMMCNNTLAEKEITPILAV